MNETDHIDAMSGWPVGRVGYCTLLGRPNAGKSTLLNQALGYHLAAVSAKPQTTRRRWLGILSEDESQLLFLDTPGVHRPRHALGEAMQRAIREAVDDADVLLCIADSTRPPGKEEALVAEAAAESGKPVFVALNKSDLTSSPEREAMAAFYRSRVAEARFFEISALRGEGVDALLAAMTQALPQGPFLFPPDQLTDSMERQIGAELIREAVMENLEQEVPHGVAVTIESWNESDRCRRIGAVVHVERKAHKCIVIGSAGRMIGRIRVSAEEKLAGISDVPVRLHIHVKVSRDWRRKPGIVRELA